MPGRNKEGWKQDDLEDFVIEEALREKGIEVESKHKGSHPKKVMPVPRFYHCLTALSEFFKSSTPPLKSCRKAKFNFLVYGFADASKSGLGSIKTWNDKATVRMGTWGRDADCESSNWRELTNLVLDLENDEASGRLDNSWIILATDNSTAEGCLYKGNSPSEKLFGLVVRLQALELRTGATILVTHVLGKRMMAQGADGVSRGSLKEGVCLGKAMNLFGPWDKSPIQACNQLEDWIKDWFGKSIEVLSPFDWYSRGHDHFGGHLDGNGRWRKTLKSGLFIWDLPPVGALAALEELRKARTKRRKSTHLVVVQKLFTPLWLRQLYKVCDLVIFIPANFTFWDESMFEPLCLGFCFPFLHHSPWQIRRAPKLLEMGRQVHKMCKEDNLDPRDLLRKLLRFTRRLPTLSGKQLRSVLFFRGKNIISDKEGGVQDKRKHKL